MLKSAAKNGLVQIESIYWWHESALAHQLGLIDTKDHGTALQLLSRVVEEVKAHPPYSTWHCASQAYGKSKPKWFLFGCAESKITMKAQTALLAAIQGAPTARIKDETISRRRKEGWKLWALEEQSSELTRAYDMIDVPALAE